MFKYEMKFHLIEEDGVPAINKRHDANFIDCVVIQKSGNITIATWSIAHQYFYSPLYKKVLRDVIAYHKCKVHPRIIDRINEYKEDNEKKQIPLDPFGQPLIYF